MEVEIDQLAQDMVDDLLKKVLNFYEDQRNDLSEKLKNKGIKMNLISVVQYNLYPLYMIALSNIYAISEFIHSNVGLIDKGSEYHDIKKIVKDLTHDFCKNLYENYDFYSKKIKEL